MNTFIRSNTLYVFIVIVFLAIQWFSNNYEDLPGWLQFTKTAYGSLAISLISSASMVAFLYIIYRESQTIEGASRRFRNILKWIFYGVVTIAVLGIPLDFGVFFAKLRANG